MNLGVHPHVIEQPFRISALREFIDHARSFDDVWFATREEIAQWYLENHESNIPTSGTWRNLHIAPDT